MRSNVTIITNMEIENAGSSDVNEFLENSSEEVPSLNDQQSVAQNVVSAASADGDQQNPASDTHEKEVKKSITSSSKNSSRNDGQNCIICFEPYTNSGVHCLVSLRCGHLFGQCCILRWLNERNTQCPHCNARARRSEIRNIYAESIKVIDSSEHNKAIQDLVQERKLRNETAFTLSKKILENMMVREECERLKKQLTETNRSFAAYRLRSKLCNCSHISKPQSGFTLEKCFSIAKNGGCRIVDTCETLRMMIVSQPSNNELVPGYGFCKISIQEMNPVGFVSVHQKPIKDMACHATDSLVLTASLDKSLRITDMLSNSAVQTYAVNSDVWSCAWDADNPVCFYGGLRTGEVYMFDIRVTSKPVHQLPRFGIKTPVASLQYLRVPISSTFRKCGLMVGKLTDCALQQKTEINGFYKVVPLPSLDHFSSLSTDTSGRFLMSCQPSVKQPHMNHNLCEFLVNPLGDLVWYVVRTFFGGKSQLLRTQSKLLSHPDSQNSLFVCAGDEDAQGILIWNTSSEERMYLRSSSPVLYISGFKINHKSYMTAVTDKNLELYSWRKLL